VRSCQLWCAQGPKPRASPKSSESVLVQRRSTLLVGDLAPELSSVELPVPVLRPERWRAQAGSSLGEGQRDGGEGAVAMVAVRVVLGGGADTDLHVAMRRRLSFAPTMAPNCADMAMLSESADGRS